jgi:ABC-2 type transport system permease protein
MTPRIITANLVIRLKSFYRERSAMFFTFAFPVILVLVFGTIFTTAEQPTFELSVQDNSGTHASERLLEGLADYQAFRVTLVPVEADPAQYARDHKLNLLLVIPGDFDALQKRRLDDEDTSVSVSFTYIYDPSSTVVDSKIHLLKLMVASANQKATGTRPFLKLDPVSILSEKYRFIEFFVPGIIAMAIMTSCLTNALHINAELRQKGIQRKLATTPITAADWLVSSILYQVILSVVSTAAILIVAYFAFDVRLHVGAWPPILALIILVEVIAFVGIGALLAPLAKEAESASAVANAFLFPMMFLSGTFFPVEMMPHFLQTFAKTLPLYYTNEALRASMIFQDNTVALWCVGVLAVFAALVFVPGTIRNRRRVDRGS